MDYGMHIVVLSAVLVMFSGRGVFGQDTCVKINSCSCKNSKGTIDLSPLASDGPDPRFKDIPSTDAGTNSFSWNPCKAFSEGSGSCTEVAVCQIQDGLLFRNFINIGKQDSATFITGSGNDVVLQYSATVRGVKRTTHVSLICDHSLSPGMFQAIGEDPKRLGNYYMTYQGVYACPVLLPGDSSGLSAGSILLIIFFVIVFIYLICGVIYQFIFRGAKGNDIIPHSSFWSSLPGLIKTCKKQPGEPPSYANVGDQGTADFQTDAASGLVTLVYTAKASGLRTTYIHLICDPNPDKLTAQGEDPALQGHYFAVGSVWPLCWLVTRSDCNKAWTEGKMALFCDERNISACQVTSDMTYFPIGTQDTASFQTDTSGVLTLSYTATLTGTLRTTWVSLTCNPNSDPGTLTASGEDPNLPTNYDLQYVGKYACPGAPSPNPTPGGPSSGLSVGSILCIIFFVALFVYVTGGVTFQIFVKKQSGRSAIPQSSFWLALPSLVKDGAVFLVRLPKKGTYDKI